NHVAQRAGSQRLCRMLNIRILNAIKRLCRREPPIGTDALNMTSREHLYTCPPSERFRYVTPEVKAGMRGGGPPRVDRRTGCKRARLRGKPDRPFALGHIERLDTERVANEPKLLV